MAKLETVKIAANNEGGFVVINKSDVTNKHKLFVEKKLVPKPKREGKKHE